MLLRCISGDRDQLRNSETYVTDLNVKTFTRHLKMASDLAVRQRIARGLDRLVATVCKKSIEPSQRERWQPYPDGGAS